MSDRRVVITSSAEGLQNMTMGALEAFLPIYAVKVVGLNEFQAGLLWGIQVLVTIVSKPIMGKFSDGSGRKAVIATGMVLCAVSFACVPLLRDLLPSVDGRGFFRHRRGLCDIFFGCPDRRHLQEAPFRDRHGNIWHNF